jgi:hypothetical protein
MFPDETAPIAMSKYSVCHACQCCVKRNITVLKAVCFGKGQHWFRLMFVSLFIHVLQCSSHNSLMLKMVHVASALSADT